MVVNRPCQYFSVTVTVNLSHTGLSWPRRLLPVKEFSKSANLVQFWQKLAWQLTFCTILYTGGIVAATISRTEYAMQPSQRRLQRHLRGAFTVGLCVTGWGRCDEDVSVKLTLSQSLGWVKCIIGARGAARPTWPTNALFRCVTHHRTRPTYHWSLEQPVQYVVNVLLCHSTVFF